MQEFELDIGAASHRKKNPVPTIFILLWLVTVDEVGWSLDRLYDLVKIKHRSRKRCRKYDGIGFGRIGTFQFSSDSAYDSVA